MDQLFIILDEYEDVFEDFSDEGKKNEIKAFCAAFAEYIDFEAAEKASSILFSSLGSSEPNGMNQMAEYIWSFSPPPALKPAKQ